MLPNANGWNVEKIKFHLPQYEVDIRKIVPSNFSKSDEMVWLLEKSGIYSTKTGYAMAKLNVADKQDDFDWRKYVWNVSCSPKIRHFLWKLKHKAVAVGESLMKRGLQVEGKCKRCGDCESVIHVMFLCPFARKVWENCSSLGVPHHLDTFN